MSIRPQFFVLSSYYLFSFSLFARFLWMDVYCTHTIYRHFNQFSHCCWRSLALFFWLSAAVSLFRHNKHKQHSGGCYLLIYFRAINRGRGRKFVTINRKGAYFLPLNTRVTLVPRTFSYLHNRARPMCVFH